MRTPDRTAPYVSLSALLLLALFVAPPACAPVPKTVCAVVDLADAACGAFVTVKMPDGTIVRVPKSEVRQAAKRSVELGTDAR